MPHAPQGMLPGTHARVHAMAWHTTCSLIYNLRLVWLQYTLAQGDRGLERERWATVQHSQIPHMQARRGLLFKPLCSASATHDIILTCLGPRLLDSVTQLAEVRGESERQGVALKAEGLKLAPLRAEAEERRRSNKQASAATPPSLLLHHPPTPATYTHTTYPLPNPSRPHPIWIVPM